MGHEPCVEIVNESHTGFVSKSYVDFVNESHAGFVNESRIKFVNHSLCTSYICRSGWIVVYFAWMRWKCVRAHMRENDM